MESAGIHGYATSGEVATGQTALSPRLVSAAHEFEGQMMKELLKPMTDSDALTGADDDTDSGAGSGCALSDFASETLGQALSERGGFGIAASVLRELSHTGNTLSNGKVTRNLNQKHALRAS